jgi:hypothetical protein
MYILHINYSNPKVHVTLILHICKPFIAILHPCNINIIRLYRNLFLLQFNNNCILSTFKHFKQQFLRFYIIPLQGIMWNFVYFEAKLWRASLNLSINFRINHCNFSLTMTPPPFPKRQKQAVDAYLVFQMLYLSYKWNRHQT